jgi:glutathione S-transferase
MKNVSPILGEPWSDAELTSLRAAAKPWIARLDQALEGCKFLVEDTFSIADIAMAEPTGLAGEGGVDLAPFPHVRAWMGRMADRPAFQKTRFVPPKG